MDYHHSIVQTNNTRFSFKKPLILFSILIVIFFSVFFLYVRKHQTSQVSNEDKIKVNSISPSQGQKSVNLTASINIKFDTDVPNKENVSYELVPTLRTESKWLDNKTLIINPKYLFNPKTTYTITLRYDSQLVLSSNFTTKSINDLSEEEEKDLQFMIDFKYASEIEQKYKEKPWLLSLPLITDKYNVVYDNEQNHIRARIKTASNSSEIEALKKEIINKLKTIGVPDSIEVFWITP